MGADVKQTGEQFGNSAKYLRWQDRAANRTFFTGEFTTFNKEAAELLLEVGVIKQIPDLGEDRRYPLHSVTGRGLERIVVMASACSVVHRLDGALLSHAD